MSFMTKMMVDGLGVLYLAIVDTPGSQQMLCEFLKLCADRSNLPLMIGCTHGKDRCTPIQ